MNFARIALLAAVCLADRILLLKITPAIAAQIITDIAPPPLRAENMGHPRGGYAWAPGHWQWERSSLSMGPHRVAVALRAGTLGTLKIDY